MSEQPRRTHADDEILAEIGRELFSQETRVTVRLPRDLAERACAAWHRQERAFGFAGAVANGRHSLGRPESTLPLIGLAVELDGTVEADTVLVDLPAWFIAHALSAADEAGKLTDLAPPAT